MLIRNKRLWYGIGKCTSSTHRVSPHTFSTKQQQQQQRRRLTTTAIPSPSSTNTFTSNIPPGVLAKVGENLHLQDGHPINIIKREIESLFDASLFYKADSLHPKTSTQQNFDDLLVPPDHPSRRISDTFYFDPLTVLRPHTSAHQTELLRAGHRAFLATGDCYRRDEIDSSHYPIFHQMEGVRVWSPQQLSEVCGTASQRTDHVAYVLEDLKTVLANTATHLFGSDTELRWVDAYFPFTDPSLELEAMYEGKWLELLGCGVIEQEILRNCQLGDHVGWAFGIGLERLAMVLFGIPDIRLFWSRDRRFLDQFADGKIRKFKEFSRYPPVYKDIAFWLSPDFHENDFCAMVREVCGDVVERVECIDQFTHPKTGRSSRCFRITYRSMDRNLTNEEIDTLQTHLRDFVRDHTALELR